MERVRKQDSRINYLEILTEIMLNGVEKLVDEYEKMFYEDFGEVLETKK